LVVDDRGVPQDLTDVFTGGTQLNKVRLEENRFK
jgi:hypothetical protein